MASRQPFLKREPWVARPKPAPVSRPQPATRRPPTRDPRVTPWRPRPKPITPKGPLFPTVKRPPVAPFGRRPPFLPASPLLPGKLRPLLPFLRLHPLVGAMLAAYDLYQLYQWLNQPGQGAPYGSVVDCGVLPRMPQLPGPIFGWTGSTTCVGTGPLPGPAVAGAVYGEWSTTHQWLAEWWTVRLSRNTGETLRFYHFPDGPPPPEMPYPPPAELPGVILPQPDPLPYPYPFAPQPYPHTPPVTRPRDEPYPQPDPYPRPQPSPRPAPTPSPAPGTVAPVPAIEFTPHGGVAPGWHEQRPPTPDEREKKKRLNPGTSAAWLNFMNNAIGSYTEVDDTVTALYKGLPWYVRRWKGRDGVWRDRDITSVARAARLGEHLGKLIIEDAITNLIVNGLTDEAFGLVGNALKQKTKELGKEGLWQGFQGPQAGGSLRGDNWQEVYEKLKKEAAKNQKLRQYTVKEMNPDGTYRLVRKTRPVTQIPWFKQESFYPRMARPGMAEWWTLTAAEKAARKKNVKAYYYAPTRTHRNLYLGEE